MKTSMKLIPLSGHIVIYWHITVSMLYQGYGELSFLNVSYIIIGRKTSHVMFRSGALLQWLKLPAWKVGDRGLDPPVWP